MATRTDTPWSVLVLSEVLPTQLLWFSNKAIPLNLFSKLELLFVLEFQTTLKLRKVFILPLSDSKWSMNKAFEDTDVVLI